MGDALYCRRGRDGAMHYWSDCTPNFPIYEECVKAGSFDKRTFEMKINERNEENINALRAFCSRSGILWVGFSHAESEHEIISFERFKDIVENGKIEIVPVQRWLNRG